MTEELDARLAAVLVNGLQPVTPVVVAYDEGWPLRRPRTGHCALRQTTGPRVNLHCYAPGDDELGVLVHVRPLPPGERTLHRLVVAPRVGVGSGDCSGTTGGLRACEH